MRVVLLFFAIVAPVYGAPSRSKTKNLPQTVYDQKQTGDYNIQLHLKDFQIIALLSDDTLGGLGDYDYNYDYSDFTVKPHVNITQKPVTSTTTEKPANNNVVASSSSSKPLTSTTTTATTSSTEKNTEEVDSETLSPTETSSTTEKNYAAPSSNPNSPDKIKVQIIQGIHSPDDSISIVPSDDVVGLSNEAPTLGEILHYRRCASGYSRDKKGRCRRVRRPGGQKMPFDISRLASNLAARFRQESAENLSGSSSSESASSESLEV